MRVLYHSDAFALNAQYGLGRYAEELWKAVLKEDENIDLIPFALKGDKSRPNPFNKDLSLNIKKINLDSRALMFMWSALGMPKIDSLLSDINLIHTVELDYPIPSTRLPWVATVHDIGPLTHKEYFSKSRPYIRKKGLSMAAKRAEYIIAVSQATAFEVQNYLQKDLSDRIKVVHEGVDESFFDRDEKIELDTIVRLPEGVPYFLWVGSINPRKNIKNVLSAFHKIADLVPHHLVLAGGVGWDVDKLLSEIKLDKYSHKIHRPGYISNQQLKCLYQNAGAFVYVSIMEGFGLPILEAMASECPVITSNRSSMPEVAGNAALLVDPFEVDDIAVAMKNLADDVLKREQLVKKGLQRAKEFTWEKCALEIIDIYKKCA